MHLSFLCGAQPPVIKSNKKNPTYLGSCFSEPDTFWLLSSCFPAGSSHYNQGRFLTLHLGHVPRPCPWFSSNLWPTEVPFKQSQGFRPHLSGCFQAYLTQVSGRVFRKKNKKRKQNWQHLVWVWSLLLQLTCLQWIIPPLTPLSSATSMQLASPSSTEPSWTLLLACSQLPGAWVLLPDVSWLRTRLPSPCFPVPFWHVSPASATPGLLHLNGGTMVLVASSSLSAL